MGGWVDCWMGRLMGGRVDEWMWIGGQVDRWAMTLNQVGQELQCIRLPRLGAHSDGLLRMDRTVSFTFLSKVQSMSSYFFTHSAREHSPPLWVTAQPGLSATPHQTSHDSECPCPPAVLDIHSTGPLGRVPTWLP